jgi:Na+/melibiose symporter-like transporter
MKRLENHIAGGMALLSLPLIAMAVIVAVFLAGNASAWLVAIAVALIVVGAYLVMKLMWAMLADGAADEH